MTMDRMPWFKWWDGTAADMKFRMVAEECALPVASVVGAWAYLLEYASHSVDRGSIVGIDYEEMSYTLQIPDCETLCNAMKRRKLLHETGDVTKWEERQGKREKSEPAGASTKRVQQFREKQRLAQQAQENKDLGGEQGGNDDDKDTGNGETDETDGNGTKRPKKKRESKSKTKTLTPSSSGDDGVEPFEKFWEAYPWNAGKQDAQRAWITVEKNWAKLNKHDPDAPMLDTLLAAIAAQKEGNDWMRENGQYIPRAATWLNGGRWKDEVRPYVEPKAKNNRGAWWATKESMEAFGMTLTPPLKPTPGEYPRDFVARIQAHLDKLDRGEDPAAGAVPTPYTPPMPSGGEEDLTNEQRQARLAELRQQTGINRKPAEVVDE